MVAPGCRGLIRCQGQDAIAAQEQLRHAQSANAASEGKVQSLTQHNQQLQQQMRGLQVCSICVSRCTTSNFVTFLQVESQALSIQLTQLEDENAQLQREFSSSTTTGQEQLAIAGRQLQEAQEAGRASSQAAAAAQEQLRQVEALLSAAVSRVQALTLQVTHLEEQLQQSARNLETANEKISAIELQLRESQEQSRSSSQAAARALETQSSSHLLALAQQRDAALETNARCGQLSAQLAACEHRLQTAAARAAAAEKRLEEVTGETSQQLELQEKALEAVSAAHKRQHDAAMAAAEHRCELLARALEESEANACAAEARAVRAELAAETAAEAERQRERGLLTASEEWQERQLVSLGSVILSAG